MPEKHQHAEVGLPDLRQPVGLFFIVLALILLAEALHSHPMRVGLPVDLYSGAVFLVFGVLMAIFGTLAGPEKRMVDDEA